MQIKQPKNNDRYYWTQHVFAKMKQYGISEQMIRRVIRNPQRVEEGVAPDTIAVMQTRGTKKKHEVWVMYQVNKKSGVKSQVSKVRVITSWRYPGISPKRQSIPIPQDIIEELNIVLK
jgi:hypothetical protein